MGVSNAILQMIRSHAYVKTLHVFTDGPTTQYRQKGNFYSMSTRPFDFGFHTIYYHGISSSQGTATRAHQMGLAGRLSEHQTAKLNLERIYRRPKCCMMFCRKQHPFNCFTSEQRKLQKNYIRNVRSQIGHRDSRERDTETAPGAFNTEGRSQISRR